MPPYDQWLFTQDELTRTPSIIAGYTKGQELEGRSKGVGFIMNAGIALKLPQVTVATACVFFHRFFMRYPMIEDRVMHKPHQHYYSVAGTSLFLASKVEENCRRMKEMVVACVRVAQKNPTLVVDEQEPEFWKWRDTLIKLEDTLLEALCFDLDYEPPYRMLYGFMTHFDLAEDKALRNASWGFLNDGLQTPLALLFPSKTIAGAAFYCAVRFVGIQLPDDANGRPWWDVFELPMKDVVTACNYMADLYETPPFKKSTSGSESIHVRSPTDSEAVGADTRKPYENGDYKKDTNGRSSKPGEERRNEARPSGNGDSHKTNGKRQRSPERTNENESHAPTTNGTAAQPPAKRNRPSDEMKTGGKANGRRSITPTDDRQSPGPDDDNREEGEL